MRTRTDDGRAHLSRLTLPNGHGISRRRKLPQFDLWNAIAGKLPGAPRFSNRLAVAAASSELERSEDALLMSSSVSGLDGFSKNLKELEPQTLSDTYP